MSDLLLPPWLCVARARMQYLDSTAISRAEFTGQTKTASKGGDRLSASVEMAPTTTGDSAEERATLLAFLVGLRGRQNRVFMSDRGRRQRGSFPTTELLTNPMFANGVSGWTANGGAVLTAADRALRITRTTSTTPYATQSVSGLTAYTPYVVRAHFRSRGTAELAGVAFTDVSSVEAVGDAYSADIPGMRTRVLLPIGTSGTFYLDGSSSGLPIFGDYYEADYSTMARCALVDNGSNLMLQSDALGTSWTVSDATIQTNATTAPDGSSTADHITENTDNDVHYITQSATRANAAADLTAFGYFKTGSSRNVAVVVGNSGVNYGIAIFDLTSGTIASAAAAAGTATNVRASIVPAGTGWYLCTVTARLPAATTLVMYAQIANGTTLSYAGNGTSGVYGWRLGASVGSVPTIGSLTTTTANTGANQSGSSLRLKGLPVSTAGLLLAGDQFEVVTSYGSELKLVTTALNSDASGLGAVKFEPPLRGVPADNAAVIIHQPMGRFLFSGQVVGWEHEPGIVTRASAEFEEA